MIKYNDNDNDRRLGFIAVADQPDYNTSKMQYSNIHMLWLVTQMSRSTAKLDRVESVSLCLQFSPDQAPDGVPCTFKPTSLVCDLRIT